MHRETEQGIIFTVLSRIRMGEYQVKKENRTFKTGNISLRNTCLRCGTDRYRVS